MKRALLLLLIPFCSQSVLAAEVYRWTDEDGVTHFSDSPTADIPAPDTAEDDEIQSAEQVPAAAPPVTDETREGALEPDFFDILNEIQEEEVVVDSPPVEIYETSWCVYCKKAKEFFRSKGIDFVTYDIEKDRQAAQRMRSFTNRMAVPFVVINGQGIAGYSVAAYEQALQN